MPGKYYMVNDYRYDHIFRPPRPDLSVKYGTPNACNNCHTDKTFQWAADAIKKWYGPNRTYHFAEDLIPGSKSDSGSEQHLIKLLNDTVPDIVKATAVNYLGNIQNNTSLNALLNCLKERDAQIRYRALKSLENFPPSLWIDEAGDLLSDSVRAVRIAAADLFVSVPPDQLPANIYDALTKEKTESEESMLYQADFSVGAMMIGDYYLKQQDYARAEKFYLLGLKKDTSANYARLNLSVAFSATGKNVEALKVLQDAQKVDPKNDRIYFNFGLLYNEMNDTVQALKSFEKAIALKSKDSRVYYDYGLLLQKKGKTEDAAGAFQKGIQLNPSDADLNYALAVLYVQTGQKEKAKKPASVLKQYYPDNPSYQKLIQYLGL
jgi:tetratricopeptide (TPR) repeat protein